MTARDQIETLRTRMGQSIIGQRRVIDRLVIGLLANGNLLIEGMPGLAKTRAVKAMAGGLEASFGRIQFTPDLLPSDVTGTEVYHQTDTGAEFRFEPGPIFANIVLADEINRAPAKVQAALLEAMEERQVTVAGTTHRMEPLFIVMATQNPVEQEGTYPLPEAQMDRFLMHVQVDYPTPEEEAQVIALVRGEDAGSAPDPAAPLPQQTVFDARAEIGAIHVSEAMARYMADLVTATRTPAALDADLARWIDLGASPRASLALDKCGRAHAWLEGRDYLDPTDIQAVAPDVFRHRLTLSFEAQGEGIVPDTVTARLLDLVALP
ncbi:putative MoxR-like ATPase [Dinoroseobacter shibae DFL 12 = DSM 16493]|jgi:MoxR-like ATPase|uniref:Putative MoxR-like ATPase n=1 Tax=Dinoroseobacter shibae (strain DSM 16493 / NCIMB 14021 / DFL 12) TaxID=398580 RepID=A8LL97_DINSH|nr:MoxR family ATPase [Dinoroseobacter shibae]ABV94846.1 putative MoxR-like ATPase [Dinoroseobacter shibae DFL 12 = DSM 16493]URF46267.1 MoxR family ATPase [Dinoroseobacter shibae]URF50574.1 MoxR family ATPase [Dinoroseobacter shibae]